MYVKIFKSKFTIHICKTFKGATSLSVIFYNQDFSGQAPKLKPTPPCKTRHMRHLLTSDHLATLPFHLLVSLITRTPHRPSAPCA